MISKVDIVKPNDFMTRAFSEESAPHQLKVRDVKQTLVVLTPARPETHVLTSGLSYGRHRSISQK